MFSTDYSSDGAGGKGTWGKLLDTDGDSRRLDRNDPNYDSGEVVSIPFFYLLTAYANGILNQLEGLVLEDYYDSAIARSGPKTCF